MLPIEEWLQYKAKVSYDQPKFIKEEHYVFGD